MPRHRLTLLLPLLALFQVACATNRLFAPRENGNGSGPTGQPAAVYVLAPPAHGEVRLWCDGCDLDEAQVPVLRLGFELENTGNEPMALDPAAVRVTGLAIDGGLAATATLTSPPARVEVAPQSTGRVDLVYAVAGDGIAPRAIQDFHVGWQVAAGDQTFSQVTPFQAFYPAYDDRWDPWPWWGFGFGFHSRRYCR